jgi:hypothetical protein
MHNVTKRAVRSHTNLNTTFNHEALESPNACFNQRPQFLLTTTKDTYQISNTLYKHRKKLTSFPGITPPQNATSTQHCPFAASRFTSKFATLVVGGIELSGMSTTVVTPPDAAASVPV